MQKLTQTQEILSHLKNGHSLTQIQALYLFGCMRLASRISDINKARKKDPSIPFIFKRNKKIKCKNGRTAYVAEYYIKKEEE